MTYARYLMLIRNTLYIPGDEDDGEEEGILQPFSVH